jgi:DNA-binding IclR family transcriptional regulator
MPSSESETQPRDGAGPKAMSRVLRLLDELARAPDGLSLADLSGVLETPKSTLINSLRPLVNDDYLIADGNLYRLGPRSFRLAATVASAWSLPRIAHGYLMNLAERTGESVALAVLDQEMWRLVYIDVIESVRPVRYAMRIGMSGPLYSTAAGRVLLAHQPLEFQEEYLVKARLQPLTSRTNTDRGVLRGQLDAVRREGCWISIGESVEDSAAMAAPLFGPDGQILAALTVGAPSDRLQANLDQFRATLKEVAAHASGRFADERPDQVGAP